MTYLPTDEDIALLKSHSPHVYCRIDLLDKDFATIDSLEGIAIDGSINVDSTSDVRRTFNTTLYLGKKSTVSAFEEEDWINKNVRVFIGLKGRVKTEDASYAAIEEKALNSAAYQAALKEYNALVTNLKSQGYDKYGHIDNINRAILDWNDENLSKYSKFVREMNGQTTFMDKVSSWLVSNSYDIFIKAFDTDPDAVIQKGDYSTVLACDDTFNGVQVCYTPLFQRDNELIPLCRTDMNRYLNYIIPTNATRSEIMLRDAQGMDMTLYGEKMRVKNMIAAVQGNLLNNTSYSAADVSAIAGWSEEELKKTYGTSSSYVGHSLHDVHSQVIEARDKVNDVFNREFEKASVARVNVFSKNTDVFWFNQGCFSISSNGFTYNSTTNTVQCTCVDLVARLNGDLAGQLTGLKTKINKGQRIGPIIKTVLTEQPMSEFSKCVIDYWTRNVPYDLEYETGTTLWEILTELRDLYYPFEMYFDDDVFVCHEIPSGFDDPPVLDPDLFASLVTADGESATVDYSTVRNCVEVFGATIDSDAYSSDVTYSSEKNALTLVVEEIAVDDEANISFIMPVKVVTKTMDIVVNFKNKKVTYENGEKKETIETVTKTSTLYKSVPDADGRDVAQDPSDLEAGKYYVIQWFPSTRHFYFLGQQQSHAMVKLVDTIPTGDKLKKDKEEENCDNLEYVCMTDPENIDDLYNSKFTIEKIGRRNEILSGGDYENYTTDEKAMEVAKYELWKKARLTDGLVVPILLVPWLDVNKKIQYAAKYLRSKTPVDWILKSLSINLGEGTMSLTMSRYYPYYPYIVGHYGEESKYNLYQDWMLDQYFPDLRSDVNKSGTSTT